MVRVITFDDMKSLIRKVTLKTLLKRLIEKLEADFSHWCDFGKMPRVAAYFEQGVIELMPGWGKDYLATKYVNGHPTNTQKNKMTVVAMGLLADVTSGYPVLISEMTLLTALRTAAASALAAKYLAPTDSKTFAIIGTGVQSEFQVLAHHVLFDLQRVQYFDIDAKAMDKFKKNLSAYPFELVPGKNIEDTIKNADIITTATADKKQAQILQADWIKPGVMINAIGGDCPGKTELDPAILAKAKVVVDYIEQAQHEGEIQNYQVGHVYAELWELTAGRKSGRTQKEDIFVFDSVGVALEDYSVLKLIYSLAEDFHVGHMMDMLPTLKNPKDLFGDLHL